MTDFNNIWKKSNKNLTEEQILAYLEGRLSIDQQREVEKWLSEKGFETDAIEGLKSLSSVQTKKSVDTINKKLNKRLNIKSHTAHNNFWTYIAIILILLIAVITYYFFHISLPQ